MTKGLNSRRAFLRNLLDMSEAQLHAQLQVLADYSQAEAGDTAEDARCKAIIRRATESVAEMMYPGFADRHHGRSKRPAWRTRRVDVSTPGPPETRARS